MGLRPSWVLGLCLAALRARAGPTFPARVEAVYHGLWQNPDSAEYGQVFMQIIADEDEGDLDRNPSNRPWSLVRGGLILRQSGRVDHWTLPAWISF